MGIPWTDWKWSDFSLFIHKDRWSIISPTQKLLYTALNTGLLLLVSVEEIFFNRWRGPKMFFSRLILKFVGKVDLFKMSSKGKKDRTGPASASVSFGRPSTKCTVEDAVKLVRILFLVAALKFPLWTDKMASKKVSTSDQSCILQEIHTY